MTWTKLSDDFGVQCAPLSADAVRLHVEALCWVMGRETGGAISPRQLQRLSEGTTDPEVTAAELVAAEYWNATPDGWQVVHHMEHQPDPEVIAARRQADAERQTRRRRKYAGLPTDNDDLSRHESRRDTPRDNMRDPGRVGSGRNGKP